MRPLLAACACAALLPIPALAQDVQQPGAPWLSNIDMPRASAMGGAHAAISTGNDAMLTNPAGLAQMRRYHFEADGVLDTRFPLQGLILSVSDSTTGPVATGFLYAHWGSGRDDGRAQGWLGSISYAYNTGAAYFGGTTKYLHFNVPDTGPSGLANPDGTAHMFMQDFGLLVRRGSFSWAAVVENLNFSFSKQPLFPLTASAGVALGADASSHFAFDYKADLSDTSNVKHKLAAGYEMLIDAFALRGGATWDTTNSLWWGSIGVGLLTEKGGLQLVYRRRFSGGLDQFFEGGITIYLE
jgi:hypothetical protein